MIWNPNGAPGAGFGMGVVMTSRSRRQAYSKPARTSSAGRAATVPQLIILGVSVNILRDDGLNFVMKKT